MVPFNTQGWMVAETWADLDVSARQVAEIKTEPGLGATAGAVYIAIFAPVAMIVPKVALPLGTPLTDQLTPGSGCPLVAIVATSWTIPPGASEDIPEGLVATFKTMSLVMFRTVLAVIEGSAWLVALIVTLAGLGSTCGAV